jgi:hypothetical protein
MYFPMATYTTLGYGDVVLEPCWSTTLIFAGVRAVYFPSPTR